MAIESKRTIEIDEFVLKSEIDELYIRDPYYIVPDGEVCQQAFAVIRKAIRKEGIVALGKVVFTSREHIIALEARGKGMVGVTLRYPYEVRKEGEYFVIMQRRGAEKVISAGVIPFHHSLPSLAFGAAISTQFFFVLEPLRSRARLSAAF